MSIEDIDRLIIVLGVNGCSITQAALCAIMRTMEQQMRRYCLLKNITFTRGKHVNFTLIEMIVSLAIMSLIASLAYASLSKPPSSLTLEIAASKLTSLLDTARRQALLRGEERKVLFDTSTRTFYLSGNNQHSIQAFKTHSTTCSTESAGSFASFAKDNINIQFKGSKIGNPCYIFFPDGTAVGPETLLESNGRILKVSISELTGMTRITPKYGN